MPKPDDPIQRRKFLTGQLGPARRVTHISSAVVTARPEHADALAAELVRLPGVEVHAVSGSKIILVLEGDSVGTVGATMAEISMMERVVSANLVFEQIISDDDEGGARP